MYTLESAAVTQSLCVLWKHNTFSFGAHAQVTCYFLKDIFINSSLNQQHEKFPNISLVMLCNICFDNKNAYMFAHMLFTLLIMNFTRYPSHTWSIGFHSMCTSHWRGWVYICMLWECIICIIVPHWSSNTTTVPYTIHCWNNELWGLFLIIVTYVCIKLHFKLVVTSFIYNSDIVII